jgi:hypothetical protein
MMPYRLAENIKIYTTNFLFRETQALKKDPPHSRKKQHHLNKNSK